MDDNFKILFFLATVLQSMLMYDAAIARNNVYYTTSSVNHPTSSVNHPISSVNYPTLGGIAVDHPAQATIYAKRGKLNVLIPFEFTIIPLTENTIEPEVPSRSSTPISGSITSQPNSNYYRANQNVHRPVYYQTSTYPWNNNNNRGFYIPASPSMSPSYQPFIQPTQQYQNGYRPIIYQQQLPANTYRNQYYSPNSNVMYAPSYQQQALHRTDVRPWPQYNRSDRPNQSQTQQQQQLPQPGPPNWSTTNTKPININEMNSIHPPNTTAVPAPSNNNNNNQLTSVATNSTTITNITTETAPKTPVEMISPTGALPTGKEQPAMPTDSVMGPSSPNNVNGDTQKERTKSNVGEQVPANQPSETNLDKKEPLQEVKSSLPQNSGQANGGGKDDNPQSSHTYPAPASLDNNNNAENTKHEPASINIMN